MRVTLVVLAGLVAAEAFVLLLRMPRAWTMELSVGEAGVRVHEAAWSPDGDRILILDSESGSLRIHDTVTGDRLLRLTGEDWPDGLAWSPDGSLILAWGGSSELAVFDSSTGHRTWARAESERRLRHAEFSPDGRLVLAVGRAGRAETRDAGTGALRTRFAGHIGDVRSAHFSPDGGRVLTCSRNSVLRTTAGGAERLVEGVDPTCRIWDTKTGACLERLRYEADRAPIGATWSPDGRRIAMWGGTNTDSIRVWDAGSGEVIADLRAESGWTGTVVYSPDGECFAADNALFTYVLIRDANTLSVRSKLVGHAMVAPDYLAFSADGRYLCSATGDGDNFRVYVWKLTSGRCVGTLRRKGLPESVVFSPTGLRLLVTDGEGPAGIWRP
jgi:WD40 repeat protein